MATLNVNGRARAVTADPSTPLLWVLRDELDMTGTKFGCGIAQCGACTVHIDGVATRSCTTPLSKVGTRAVTTIEALSTHDSSNAKGDTLHLVQRAWVEVQAPQCGYCQSGQIMSAVALLATTPNPTDAEIDTAMSGNICRCGAYQRIRAAIHRAAEMKRGG